MIKRCLHNIFCLAQVMLRFTGIYAMLTALSICVGLPWWIFPYLMFLSNTSGSNHPTNQVNALLITKAPESRSSTTKWNFNYFISKYTSHFMFTLWNVRASSAVNKPDAGVHGIDTNKHGICLVSIDNICVMTFYQFHDQSFTGF